VADPPAGDPRAGPAARDRLVAVVTLVVGAGALAATLTTATALGLAAAGVWLTGSALLSRPPARPLTPGTAGAAVALGAVAYGGFVAVSYVARLVPVLDNAIDSILATADEDPLLLVLVVALVSAAAEELWFRHALLTVFGPVAATALYVLTTAATLNASLVAAAAVMGPLLMFQRQRTGTPLAPTITHLTWSTLMLLAFPG
jgi:uncharacterized protein